MRKLAIAIIFLSFGTAWSQDGFQIGIDVTPSWKLNYHNSKVVQGIRSFENGYGFSAGFPMKYWLKEHVAMNSGVMYEFTAFDRFQTGVLVNSRRFSSVRVPLAVHIRMRNELFLTLGSGANYIFGAKRIDLGLSVPIGNTLRRFQPYFSFGMNFFRPRDKGALEVGGQARYYFLDIWTPNEPNFASTSSHFVCLDFFLRYYIN